MTRVWIDQDLCTGCGLCPEIAESIFVMEDDGLAYVYDSNGVKKLPGQTVDVSKDLENSVIEASEECPGCCIFVEHD